MSVPDVSSIVIERDVSIPMRDGVALVADVYRPAEGRWPVLVQRSPYGRIPFPDNFVSLNPVTAAAKGFAVIVQDVRGRGGSGGDFEPFMEFDDGFDTVQWAAEQPWSTGRVGAFGASYMGATTMQMAASGPPALQAFAALQASSDYYEGRSYWGGALELGALLSTNLGVMAIGSLPRVFPDPRVPRARVMRASLRRVLDELATLPVTFPLRDRLDDGSGVLETLTPWFPQWLDHDAPGEYWEARSIEKRYDRIHSAGVHVTSWYDAMLPGTLANFTALRAAGRTPQRLIVGPWFHYALRGFSIDAVRVGDLSFGPAAAMDLDRIQISWLGAELDDRPQSDHSPVRLFVMGANEWRNEDEWPLRRAQVRPLYLAGDGDAATDLRAGALVAEEPTRSGGDEFVYDPTDPVPTAGGAHVISPLISTHGPVDQRDLEARADVLSYTGPALASPVEVTGYVRAELWITSSAPSTDFTARLVDVYPDGRAISVCDGIRRLFVEEGAGPGVVRRVEIEMGATSQVFLRGHRIRVDVSSSNYPRFDPNPNTGERSLDAASSVPARQRVLSGPETPSRLLLPFVEG